MHFVWKLLGALLQQDPRFEQWSPLFEPPEPPLPHATTSASAERRRVVAVAGAASKSENGGRE
jgi:hypothetical protein